MKHLCGSCSAACDIPERGYREQKQHYGKYLSGSEEAERICLSWNSRRSSSDGQDLSGLKNQK